MNSIAEKYINEKGKYRGRIKIYPDILLKAARGQNGGAVRLWFLGKHFNNMYYEGSGLIPRKSFRHWIINDLKWKPGTYDRYLFEAQKLGLIEISHMVYKLAGWEKGAVAVGIFHVCYDEQIPLKQFAGKYWLAYSYAAFINQLNNGSPSPISARTISELTGIPIRTIYSYDKITGIKKQGNIAYHPKITTGEQIAYEILNKGRNMWVDMQDRTLQRLPSTRTVPEKVSRAKTKIIKDKITRNPLIDKNGDPIKKRVYGMRRTINRKLNLMADSSIVVRVQHEQVYIDGKTEQAKNKTERKLISRNKKLARQDKSIPDHLYRLLKIENNTGVYLAI